MTLQKLFVAPLLAVMALAAIAPMTAQAAVFETSESVDWQTETEENVYLAGSKVTTGVTIGGDVFAAGQDVTIEGDVEGDVFAAGETVVVTGAVTGDVRVAGATVVISGNIEGDLIAFGESVEIAEGATVSGEVHLFASTVILSGIIEGPIEVRAETVEVSGTIQGASLFDVANLTFKGSAIAENPVTYESPNEPNIASGSSITQDQILWTKTRANESQDILPELGAALRDMMVAVKTVSALMLLVSVAVFYLVTRKHLPKLMEDYTSSWPIFGKTIFTGFAGFILIPFASFMLLITIAGAGLGTVLGLLYIVSLIVAKWLGAVLIGSHIFKLFKKEKMPVVSFWSTMVGALAIVLLGLWWPLYLVLFVVLLAGFGIILRRILPV